MTVQTVRDLLAGHDFFADLAAEHLDVVAGCGTNRAVDAGTRLLREGEAADEFYVIRAGRVAVEVFVPQRGPLVVETLGPGQVLGWSWLLPPHRWHFDAEALTPTRLVALDGACLRGKCEDDPVLGYALLTRFARIMVQRLTATRMRLLDLYGAPGDGFGAEAPGA